MFKIFKRNKVQKVDPILEMLNKQTEELAKLNEASRENRELVEQQIAEAEEALRKRGYTQKDINKLKIKVVK